MNVVLPFHSLDKARAFEWLQWVKQLGGNERHALFLMPFKGLELPDDLLHQTYGFDSVTIIPDAEGVISNWSTEDRSVPRSAAGANSFFKQLAWHFYLTKIGAWMLCEPDCIPLHKGCFDEIEAEYQEAQCAFMGRLVPAGKSYPAHMTGNGVYPQNTPELCDMRFDGTAWDVAIAGDVVPRMHNTKRIQHVFRAPGFADAADMASRIEKGAAFYHSNADGSLIRLLREKRELIAGVIEYAELRVFPQLEREAQIPQTTWISGVREHVTALQSVISTTKHKALFHAELRKAGLLGAAKKRK